jgi:SAM-dependent methyltransferase
MGGFRWLTATSARDRGRPADRCADIRVSDEENRVGLQRSRLTLDNAALLETIRSYDVSAREYADRFAAVDLRALHQRFLALIPDGDKPVLDAGCGPGRDCEFFTACGLKVIGADISAGLLGLASQRTKVNLMRCDLRWLPFGNQSFRGVWSCASLVHLAHKDAERAIRGFGRVLIPGGTLFLSVRDGTGQEWRTDSKGRRRWFQLYEKNTLEEIVASNGFNIIECEVAAGAVGGQWVNLFARRA